ncbi:hypothetical protein KKD52_06610 [Myxococcota bacterium]|jgi:hypothetical protein|nr:hypothetical protein [Myxococcota bacterium]MBU1413258.1 hypothetical protein [Myxococcota bacterium]MBU1510015.1 hypothetical protein [Myxococcota bacterium]
MFLFGFFFAWQLQWQTGALPPVVAAPDGVPEYERQIRHRLADGSWRRFSPGAELAPGQVVFTFGSKSALATRLPGRRVIEFFVAGSQPLVEGHEIVAWDPPVGAQLFLFNEFAKNRQGRPFCVLATRRTGEWARRLVMESSGLVTAETVKVPGEALKLAADLIAGRRSCAGVQLTGDFEVLDSVVLEAFVRLQVRVGIPVFGRTRHEVLLGVTAAVEPRYESWDPQDFQSTGGQIFYNKYMSMWFGVEEINSPQWKPQSLAR